MTKPSAKGVSSGRHCSECGVELKAGLKYCDFCGRKVPEPEESPAAGTPPSRETKPGVARLLLRGAGAALAVGVLAYAGWQLREPPATPPPLTPATARKQRASDTCEAAVRRQPISPFRVIAFRSTLVGEEVGGYVVTGTVELQSAVGEVKRRRYRCKVRLEERGGAVLDELKLD